jgi:hypothetical protein
MSLSKCFYSVRFEYLDKEHSEMAYQEFTYNDVNTPIRYRREMAERKFLEFVKNKSIIYEPQTTLKICFHESETAAERILFRVSAGEINNKSGGIGVHFKNLRIETKIYDKAKEPIIGNYIKVKVEKYHVYKIINDEFCKALGLKLLLEEKY